MPRTPFKCPVCDGSGNVPPGFYDPSLLVFTARQLPPVTCRTCEGRGVVWAEWEQPPATTEHVVEAKFAYEVSAS